MSSREYTRRHGLRIVRITGKVIAGIAFAVLLALLFGFVVQYVWNWLVPDLFGLKTITYLQAFALIILARLLIGGFGGHHGRYGRGHGSFLQHPYTHHGKHAYFDEYWQDEGRAAFEAYVSRIEASQRGKDDG